MPLNGDEPRETADVAADVIKEFEDAAGGGDETVVRESTDIQPDTKTDEKPAGEKKAEEKPVKKDEKKPDTKPDVKDEDDDDFDKVPAEIDDPNPRNKGKKIMNRLPHDRVKRMVEKARKAAREAADVEWRGKHEPLEQQFQDVLADIRRLDNLMATDPDAFLAEVGKAHPAYREFVRQAKAAEKAAAEDPEPQPDVPNEKGEMAGYSIAQAKKLIQWTARQEAAAVRKDLEPTVAAVKTAQQMAADRKRQDDEDAAYMTRAEQDMADAEKNLPGFKENKDAIEKIFMANKSYRLSDAYWHWRTEQLTKAAADARALVLEELKTTPLDTSAGGGGSTEREATNTKPMTTEEIARDEMRKAGML